MIPLPVTYVVAAALVLGALPLRYGYYLLLRLVACAYFGFAAYFAHQNKRELLPWIYGALALLFNPLIPVFLPKGLWMLIDLGAAIFAVSAARHGANGTPAHGCSVSPQRCPRSFSRLDKVEPDAVLPRAEEHRFARNFATVVADECWRAGHLGDVGKESIRVV